MDTITVSLITFVGTVALVGGVALFVFNGTKKLVREIAETTKGIKEIVSKQTETLNKQTEMLNKQTEMLRNQDEILKTMKEGLNRQTEILNHIANLVVEESRANRELLLRIDSKVSSRSDYIAREK